jgi:hypothetical protein
MKMTTLAHRLLYITVYLLLAVVAAKLTAEDKDTVSRCRLQDSKYQATTHTDTL